MTFGKLFPASQNMYIFRCTVFGYVSWVAPWFVYPWLLVNSNLLQLLISFALAAPTQWYCQTASQEGIIVTPCMHVATDVHAMVSFQGGISKPIISSRATSRWRRWPKYSATAGSCFVSRDDSTLFWEPYVAWRCTTEPSAVRWSGCKTWTMCSLRTRRGAAPLRKIHGREGTEHDGAVPRHL
jgi:hypothetical protein